MQSLSFHLPRALARLSVLALSALCVLPMAAHSATAATAPAQSGVQQEPQRFTATLRGMRTDLQLLRSGNRYSGQVTEGAVVLQLSGQGRGSPSAGQFSGQLTGPSGSGLALPFEADLQGDVLNLRVFMAPGQNAGKLRLYRVGSAALASAGKDNGSGSADAADRAGNANAGTDDNRGLRTSGPTAAGLDPALVGRWVHSNIITSAGGAGGSASFATERAITLAADGRARQTVRSAGGGSNWSSSSGERVEFNGRWQVRGTDLWLQPDGQAAFQPAGRYALIDGRLVVYTGQGRQIWTR